MLSLVYEFGHDLVFVKRDTRAADSCPFAFALDSNVVGSPRTSFGVAQKDAIMSCAFWHISLHPVCATCSRNLVNGLYEGDCRGTFGKDYSLIG